MRGCLRCLSRVFLSCLRRFVVYCKHSFYPRGYKLWLQLAPSVFLRLDCSHEYQKVPSSLAPAS